MADTKKVLIATSSFGQMDKAPLEKLKANGFEVVSPQLVGEHFHAGSGIGEDKEPVPFFSL